MKRILYLVSTSHIGGVEQLVLRLGRALRDRHRIDVAVIDSAGPLHEPYFRTFGTRWDVHTYRLPRGLGPKCVLQCLPLPHYDLLHCFNHFALAAALIEAGCAAKLVQSVHFHPDAMAPAWRELLRENQDKLAGLIVDSPLHLQSLPSAVCIPNFVDTDRYRPSPGANGDAVLWVGKFTPAKGPALLLEIIRQSDRRFIVVDGMPTLPAAAIYHAELRRFGDRVELVTAADEQTMLGLYARSSHLLITSEHEGTPLCLLEGMACGLVPVSTVAGNCPRVIADVGVFYASAYEAAALLHFGDPRFEDPMLPLLSERARQRAEVFYSCDAALPAYCQVYDDAMNPCNPRRQPEPRAEPGAVGDR